MMNNIGQKIGAFVKKQGEAVGALNSRIFLYAALVYLVSAVQYLFPYYSLYTFKNFTYLFLLQTGAFVFYRRRYFAKTLKTLGKHLSIYFDITNFFLAITTFIGIFLSSIPGVDMSMLTSLFIVLFIGSVYNSIYKDAVSPIFQKTRISGLVVFFVVAINGGMYFFLSQFSLRNGLHLPSFIIPITLLVFNGAILFLFTDALELISVAYADRMALLSRKAMRKWRLAQKISVPVLSISLMALGAYFGYGFYTRIEKTLPPQVSVMEDADFPADFFSSTNPTLPASGSVTSELAENQKPAAVSIVTDIIEAKPTTKLETPKSAIKRIRDIYAFDRYIGMGNEGKDVIELQTILKRSGFYNGAVTGKFDIATGNALGVFIRAKTGTRANYTQLGPKALSLWNSIVVE